MITLYIYDKQTGEYLYSDTGIPEFVMGDLKPRHGFTLTPPRHTGPCWWDGGKWVKVEAEPKPLEDRQDEAWEGIKQRRYEATVSGVFAPSVDKVFHTDATSVIQYNNIGNMIALGNYKPIQWKVKDNSWITMTEEVFKDLQIAMVQNTNRIYQVAEVHKAKMMEMDNPEDYDYSEGWDVAEPSN